MTSTITITFGERAENHVGMQQVGQTTLASEGFTFQDFEDIKTGDPEAMEIIELRHEDHKAHVLVYRNGANRLMKDPDFANSLHEELKNKKWDTKAFMYGRVVNKRARYNLVFSDFSQEPDYTDRKGRVYMWEDVPCLQELKCAIEEDFGHKASDLQAEGNLYYDIKKCGIGYHGDSERKIVIALRLGATIPLQYQWYHQNKPVGEPTKIEIRHGDIYIMSEKATGYDWKKRSLYTLRHSAGCPKFCPS